MARPLPSATNCGGSEPRTAHPPRGAGLTSRPSMAPSTPAREPPAARTPHRLAKLLSRMAAPPISVYTTRWPRPTPAARPVASAYRYTPARTSGRPGSRGRTAPARPTSISSSAIANQARVATYHSLNRGPHPDSPRRVRPPSARQRELSRASRSALIEPGFERGAAHRDRGDQDFRQLGIQGHGLAQLWTVLAQQDSRALVEGSIGAPECWDNGGRLTSGGS